MNKFKGEYSTKQKEINNNIKAECDWKCERCGNEHDPESGHTLTVHHLDGDKSNNEKWNLACLCQRCHLSIQGKVFLPQYYMFNHSKWFEPHLKGYYKSKGIKYEG